MYFLRNVLRSISLTLDKGDVEYWKRKLKYDRRKRTQAGQQRQKKTKMKIGKETGNKGGARKNSKSKKKKDKESQKMGAKTLKFPHQLRCQHGRVLLSFHSSHCCQSALTLSKSQDGPSATGFQRLLWPLRVGLILHRALQSWSIALPLYVPCTDTMSTSRTNHQHQVQNMSPSPLWSFIL